jgi:hypothetical protein
MDFGAGHVKTQNMKDIMQYIAENPIKELF